MNSAHLPKRGPCNFSICNKCKFFRTSIFFEKKKQKQKQDNRPSGPWDFQVSLFFFFKNIKKRGPCQSAQLKPRNSHSKMRLLKSSYCISVRLMHKREIFLSKLPQKRQHTYRWHLPWKSSISLLIPS